MSARLRSRAVVPRPLAMLTLAVITWVVPAALRAQDVVVSAAKALPEFQYDAKQGSFKGWLLTITQRRIIDQHRKGSRWKKQQPLEREDESPRTATEERFADPNAIDIGTFWDIEWKRNLAEIAMERVKKQVKGKLFQIFDFYVNKEWSVKEVCRTLNVTAPQVYLAKHRVSKLIQKEMDRIAEKMN